jgi:hypothetical protein
MLKLVVHKVRERLIIKKKITVLCASVITGLSVVKTPEQYIKTFLRWSLPLKNISGFRLGVVETNALLGCSVA